MLDKFVLAEQSVAIGETVVRRYTPACPSQKSIVINIYSADTDDAQVRNLNTVVCYLVGLTISDMAYKEYNSTTEILSKVEFGVG